MGRRNGELSNGTMDSGFPHQVVLQADQCGGTHYPTIHTFCRELSSASCGHALIRDDRWWTVFCFVKPEDAEAFCVRFGGEKFDPACRSRGADWARWLEPKKRIDDGHLLTRIWHEHFKMVDFSHRY